MEISFNVRDGESTREISSQEISDYASLYGINRYAKSRYSSLFIINLITLHEAQGIDPSHVIKEIKCLEGLGSSLRTKPPSEFKGTLLRGLWHKHKGSGVRKGVGSGLSS